MNENNNDNDINFLLEKLIKDNTNNQDDKYIESNLDRKPIEGADELIKKLDIMLEKEERNETINKIKLIDENEQKKIKFNLSKKTNDIYQFKNTNKSKPIVEKELSNKKNPIINIYKFNSDNCSSWQGYLLIGIFILLLITVIMRIYKIIVN